MVSQGEATDDGDMLLFPIKQHAKPMGAFHNFCTCYNLSKMACASTPAPVNAVFSQLLSNFLKMLLGLPNSYQTMLTLFLLAAAETKC